MKHFFLCCMLLFLASASFGQQATTSTTPTRADYLRKSRTQKIVAWSLLGVGATMFIIAAPGEASFGTLGTLVTVGAVSTLASIPFFIAAGKNKRRAANATTSLNFQKASYIQQTSTNARFYPAISLKIHL